MKNSLYTFSFMMVIIATLSCQKELNTSNQSSSNAKNNGSGSVVLPATSYGVCDYIFDEAAATSGGWVRIFDEPFNNLANWNVWTGGAFNNELQYYQASNLSIALGNLKITAKKENITGATTPWDATLKAYNYTSGRIESKTLFSASTTTPKVRMVARIKLPSGYGMWPAFWSYGDPWPTQGEIDILEARGQEPFTYSTNYFYGKVANRNLVKNASATITSAVSLQSCWHVYELIWSQSSLEFYLDGVLVNTKSGSYVPNLYGKKEKITLNLAVGGNFFSNLNPSSIVTGTMEIDWVKVFKK